MSWLEDTGYHLQRLVASIICYDEFVIVEEVVRFQSFISWRTPCLNCVKAERFYVELQMAEIQGSRVLPVLYLGAPVLLTAMLIRQ